MGFYLTFKKVVSLSVERMCTGRVFQVDGAETE